MLTEVSRKGDLKVVKRHHDEDPYNVFDYQVHSENDPLNPVVCRFDTKEKADRYIGLFLKPGPCAAKRGRGAKKKNGK